MEPRDELEMLRKRKRLAELEAKAAGTPAVAPVETPAVGGAKPPASYPLAGAGINQPSDIPGVGLLVNTGETILNAGAKAASGYAGLLGSILPGPEGQGADWQRRTNAKLNVGVTPNADPLANLPGQAINAVAEPLNNTAPGQAVSSFVDNTPGVKEGLEGALDISALLGVGNPMNVVRSGVNAGREAISDSSKLLGARRGKPANGGIVPGPGDKSYLGLPIAEASRAGINVTPWEVQQGVPGGAQSVKGSTRAGFGTGAVNKDTAMGNAPRINELGVRGMPDGVTVDPRTGRIEPGVIEGAKAVERTKYDAVRQVPGDGTSLELQQSLAGVARGLQNVPESVAKDVQRIISSKAQGGASTKLVDDIMELRQDATMNGKRAYNTNDPTARQLAGYQRQVADQLEEELARRGDAAGLQNVRETLQGARVNFAKLSTLEEAVDDGFIDAARLEGVQNGGGYLSDGLADVAKYNKSASVSMTHPKRITQAIEPNFRAGATPTDVAARSAQFIGGNWLTKKIGKGGVNAINEELRGFRVPEQPAAPRPPPFNFQRAPEPMGPPFPTGQTSPVPPPQAPPLLTASEPPLPRGPDMPSAGRPGPGGPHISDIVANDILNQMPEAHPGPGYYGPQQPAPRGVLPAEASQRSSPVVGGDFDARDLALEGASPPTPQTFPPGVRPTDVVDFEPQVAPPAPGTPGVKPPMTQDAWRLSDGLALEAPPEPFSILGETPPPTPKFGPGDEFPEPAPQGPPPAPPESGVVSVTPTEHMVYHNGQVDGPYTTRDSADLVHAYLAEKYPGAPTGEAPVGVAEPAFMRGEKPPAVSDDLSLVEDNRPRGKPDEGFHEMVDTPVPEGSKFVTSPGGFLSYSDDVNPGRRTIGRARIADAAQGNGEGKSNIMQLAKQSADDGLPLDSDKQVLIGQLGAYNSLRDAGKITFDVDEAAFQKALKNGTDLKGDAPVITNIRPVEGGNVSDTLSPKAEKSPVKFESRKRTGMRTFNEPRRPPTGENVSDTLGAKPDIIGTDPGLPPQWRGQAKKVADEDAAYEATQKATGDAQRSIIDLAKRVDAGDDTAVGALLDAIDSSPSQYLDTVRAKAKLLREGGAGKDPVGDLLKAIDYDIGLE